ncbi:MAG: PAS domain S-box protein [Deltaproteobacteria bacterium]|nr:PAS domain S-box protein [Deltaproteobacteria bacterium]
MVAAHMQYHAIMSHLKKIKLSVVLLCFVIIFMVNSQGWAAETPQKRVLVLHSYYLGFTWTDDITKGINEAFAPWAGKVELYYEFMDAKRHPETDYLKSLNELYQLKYPAGTIDLIICSDDQALTYLLTTGAQLFPNVPVVFCGVNDYDSSMRNQGRPLTGVIERIDPMSTLDIALKLHPNTRRIVVITDSTRTGRAIHANARNTFQQYADWLEFSYLYDCTMEELQQEVAKLSGETLLFLFVFNRDRSGKNFTHEKSLELIKNHCHVPIYSFWNFYLDHGIVGGMVTNGQSQGKVASELATRILEGEKASEIPVITESPNEFMFDYKQLQQFSISRDQLPKDSIIVNLPGGFYEKYRKYIWGFILILLVQMGIIIILAVNIVQRRRVQVALRASEEKYRSLIETLSDIVFTLDLNGKFTYFNPEFEKITGYTTQDFIGKHFIELLAPEYVESTLARFKKGLSGEPIPVYEIEVIHRDGLRIPLELKVSSIIGSDGKPTGRIGVARNITERKYAEEVLRKERDFSTSLIQSSPAFFVALTAEGKTIMMNEPMLAALGYTEEEVVDTDYLLTYVPETDREMVSKVFDQLTTMQQPTVNENRVLTRDGRELTVEWHGRTVYKEDGEFDFFFGVGMDVTDKKQSAEALRESEARFRSIVENSHNGILIVDEFYKFIYVNDELCGMLDYLREEIIGHDFREFLDDEAIKIVSDHYIRRQKDEKIPRRYEFNVVRKNGTKRRVEISSSVIKDASGNIRTVAQLLDITERTRAEETLKESEKKYRLITENTDDFIAIIALEGNFLYASPSHKKFGYHPEDLVGMSAFDLIHPEDRIHLMSLSNSYAKLVSSDLPEEQKEDIVEHLEFRFLDTWGEWHNLETTANVVKSISGEGYDALCVSRDMTRTKHLESKLQQAQKMEAVGTLAGGIAHDFNNLLMGIQGNVSLMILDIGRTHFHYDRLKNVEQYVRNGAELTKQLLGFARGGKYEVKPTDLNELLKKNSDMFGRTKKEITIHRKLQENIWPVEVDQGQIDQVLLNLYVNAWQAMPGGGSLYIETANITLDENYVKPHHVAPGKYVKISIADTGTGMDNATKARIFDPFFTTKEMGRGTGLGLASAYGIIVNHNGIITVDSEKGSGTVFTIYLPASDKVIGEEEERHEDLLTGTETVLLVDDEDMILDVGTQILEKIGYQVITASSGKKAAETYTEKQNEIDLVILDIIMPELSGGETHNILKEINPNIKVLLSSGYSIDDQAKDILDRGCNGFIQKPFNIEALSQKIREILDNRTFKNDSSEVKHGNSPV